MRNLVFVIVTLMSSILIAQCPKEKVVELIELAGQLKEQLVGNYWQEWAEIDMPILHVDDTMEYVFNTEVSDMTFQLPCNYQSRKTRFNKSFLATFPFLNGKPTIVVGTPENTSKSPEAWTLTLLHEHFHQLQFSHPNYYTAQKGLNLDKGDQTGMWMLNHPFPYQNESVNAQLKAIASNLLKLDSVSAQQILKDHKSLKNKLKEEIGEEHFKYLNLQLWQEGYARYIELELTKDWIKKIDQIKQNQFTLEKMIKLQNAQESEIKAHLTQSSPKELERVYFYALGTMEARLIARTNKNWKTSYFDYLFTTDHMLGEK